MISQSVIQQVLDTAIIEEVIGEFVQLKKKGSTYVGLSPFTDEKSPSFHVSPSKRIFKCFSTGKGGNVLSFIMEHEQYSYPEAIRFLAKKYNIEIPEEKLSPDQIFEEQKRETLFAINRFALEYFAQQLHETDEGKSVGLSYFKSRGFTPETIKTFQLGYCSSSWEGFYNALVEKKYNPEFAEELGLIKNKNGKHFDFFRERIIFPIFSTTGRPIAFAGRTLKSDNKIAKYINSSESEIYNKSKSLYGIQLAKNEIVKQNNCYLVEGYTDVISLYQAGIHNVVASSGTSLTKEQIYQIRRYTKNITILYDGDDAGIKASFRGIDLILEEGMYVKTILFPEGNDPDSFARNHTLEEIKNFLTANEQDLVNFKIKALGIDALNDPIRKAELIRDIINSISLIPDQIIRALYSKEAAALLQVSEQTIINEINKIRKKKTYDKSTFERTDSTTKQEVTTQAEPNENLSSKSHLDKSLAYLEKSLVQKLIEYGKEWIVIFDENDEQVEELAGKHIIQQLTEDDIKPSKEEYLILFNAYANYLKEHSSPPDLSFFTQHENELIRSTAVDLISSPYSISENWQKKHQISISGEQENIGKSVNEILMNFRLLHLDKQFEECQQKLKTCDETNVEEVMNELKIILDFRNKFADVLNRIILK
jgi:DNA primase